MKASFDHQLRHSDKSLAPISVLVLLVCLFFTFSFAYFAPYSGLLLYEDNRVWTVVSIEACDADPDSCDHNPNDLQVGDEIIAIGGLSVEAVQKNRNLVRFGGYKPGDQVPLTVVRNGEATTIPWPMPEITFKSRIQRLSSLFFYLPFWLAGTVIWLFLRPRGERWQLLITFNYLLALWLAAGIVSYTQVAASSIVLHALSWLLVPVSLHLHLVVPYSLVRGNLRHFLHALYALAIALAILELFQLLPTNAYLLGLLLAISSSLLILVWRSFDTSSTAGRLASRIMLVGIAMAFGPGLILWLLPTCLGVPLNSSLVLVLNITTLALPLLPAFYIYAIFKRYLGAMEFRANRLISLYSFNLLYLTAFTFVTTLSVLPLESSIHRLVISLILAAVAIIAAPNLSARYQRLVDGLLYGTRYNPEEIIQRFADQIPVVSDRDALVEVLTQELLPSLLIRQSALFLLENENYFHPLYTREVHLNADQDASPHLTYFLKTAGKYYPPLPELLQARGQFAWVRLAIALKIQDKNIGVWLFGRRDPDDFYSYKDISLLTTLGNEAAVALQNTKLVQNLTQANLELLNAYDATIQGWAYALELRSDETREHSLRVTKLTLDLARAMGVSDEELVHVRRGALLHDIGKMGIPDRILQKEGPLTEEEWVFMRKHPEYAYKMLSSIAYLGPALEIPYLHHEKWDGSGYPLGLKGEEIPLSARIFAIVDVWDALTTPRPYRPYAVPREEVIAYLKAESGKHFDPRVVEAFLSLLTEASKSTRPIFANLDRNIVSGIINAANHKTPPSQATKEESTVTEIDRDAAGAD